MPELTPLDDNRQEHFLNGEDLEPITRREHFYAGRESELPAGHQEPETREEWFIQKYRGGGGDVTVVPLSVTENGTYSEEGKAYSPVSVNVPLPENAYLLKSVANLPQPIASFSDGAVAPMMSLKVAIEPQQDLHGYDAPWVGGSGKNILPLTVDNIKTLNGGANSWTNNTKVINGITYTILTDGNGNVTGINMNGTANSTSMLFLYNSNNIYNDMKVNGCPNGSDYNTYNLCFALMQSPWTTLGVVDSAPERTITIANDVPVACYLNVENGKSVSNKVAYPMIRLASVTDATFAPYSNICPISGWDEADVSVCGINYFDKTTVQNGYVNDATGAVSTGAGAKCTDFIKIMPNTSYYVKSEQTSGMWGAYYDKNKNYVSGVTAYSNSVITTPNNACYVRLTVLYNNNGNIDTFALNYPSTDTSYHAYNGHTYTIDLDGTRYGGEVDVVNGVCKPYKEYDSYNGETLVGPWMSDRDVYAEGTTPTIGAQVVDMGAYDTDVATQPTAITTLLGANNIWADTGNIEVVEYFSKEV